MIQRLWKDKVAIYCFVSLLVIFLCGIFAPSIAPHSPYTADILIKNQNPSATYLLGTDYMGRCVLSRLIFGIRNTIFLSVLTSVTTLLIALFLSFSATFYKGWLDSVLMRIVDGMQAFPSDLLVLVLVGALGAGKNNIVLAIVLIRCAWYTRMLRSTMLDVVDSHYVQFAKIQGATPFYIFKNHIVRVILPEIIMFLSMSIGSSIVTISGFSFLGLGVQPPEAEWGNMLSDAWKSIYGAPFKILPPALCIVATVFAFYYLSDTLQDILHQGTTEDLICYGS